jgi:hypothetical protein
VQALIDFITGLIEFVLFLASVVALVSAWGYNSLRKLAENVKEAHSNIDVALRKKISLVNQLIDVAGKYMDRESLVMLKVSQDAHAAATAAVYQQTATVLSTIQGLAQRFPDLKSSEQYSRLGEAISQSETDVQAWRIRCNAAIKEYNSTRSALPHALYAGFLGFRPASYLALDVTESSDAFVQKALIADDGDRLNEVIGIAAARVLDATKAIAAQGKELAGRAASHLQDQGLTAAAGQAGQYLYLDAANVPQGPVSRAELDALFRSGAVVANTRVLEMGSRLWTPFSALQGNS